MNHFETDVVMPHYAGTNVIRDMPLNSYAGSMPSGIASDVAQIMIASAGNDTFSAGIYEDVIVPRYYGEGNFLAPSYDPRVSPSTTPIVNGSVNSLHVNRETPVNHFGFPPADSTHEVPDNTLVFAELQPAQNGYMPSYQSTLDSVETQRTADVYYTDGYSIAFNGTETGPQYNYGNSDNLFPISRDALTPPIATSMYQDFNSASIQVSVYSGVNSPAMANVDGYLTSPPLSPQFQSFDNYSTSSIDSTATTVMMDGDSGYLDSMLPSNDSQQSVLSSVGSSSSNSPSPSPRRGRGRPRKEKVKSSTEKIRQFRLEKKTLDEQVKKYGVKAIYHGICHGLEVSADYELAVMEIAKRNPTWRSKFLKQLRYSVSVAPTRGRKRNDCKENRRQKSREYTRRYSAQRKPGVYFLLLKDVLCQLKEKTPVNHKILLKEIQTNCLNLYNNLIGENGNYSH
uniref:BHLH domain-containing protein n=1 Tax=Panagrellus redivivus TaxID=6233 RepID=A0A7E4VR49_PANRE